MSRPPTIVTGLSFSEDDNENTFPYYVSQEEWDANPTVEMRKDLLRARFQQRAYLLIRACEIYLSEHLDEAKGK